MTWTDDSKEAGTEATGDSRELDWVAGGADQATRGADQPERGMDLDPAEDRAPISVADNACASGPSKYTTVAMEERENFRAPVVIEGMDIEQGDAEKKSAEREKTEVAKAEIAQIERKSDTEDYGTHKAEVSSSRGDHGVVAANITIQDPDSPVNESSPDRPLSRPRRSDSSRPGLRKLNTAKTRSSSLTSQRSAKLTLNHDPYSGATPESKANHDVRGSRKRAEDGEELRQTSISEELNGYGEGDGDEVDGTGYRCGICNDDFESAKSLSLHKKYHPQYTLRRNPKRSRKLIDQEYTVEAGVAVPVQASAPTKKTSSMSEEFPKPCTECGKEFPSWKALFGHMRCHPEREWRGIQPPTEKSNPGGQGSGPHAGGAGNHTNFRRKKPAPAAHQLPPPPAPSAILLQEENERSGSLDSRRATHVAGKASDNESDTESIEAAYMSNGDRHAVMGWMKRSKRSRQTHRSLDAVNSAKTESNDMIEALMLLQSADKEKLTLVLTPESHGRKSRSKSRTPESGLEAEADELPQMDSRKVKTESEVASPCGDTEDGGDDFDAGDQGTSARSKFECATCKRQFKSHQALGGHRASHKKVKGCFARTNVNEGGAHEQSQDSMEVEDEELLKSEEQLANSELPETSHNSEEDKPFYLTTARDDNEEMLNAARKAKAHECTICHRVFTSGQALGGHKRCHWGGGNGTPGSNEVTSASKPVQTGQQSRPFKEGVQLDLNLPAPEFLEEEMAQQDMEAGISPMNYLPAGAGLSFFNIMNNSSRDSYGDSPVDEQGQPEAFESSEAISNNQVESSRMEGITQFSNYERTYGPLDTITIHQKPHVASMALVPGLTPTSA